jgi:hypothetical protein
MYEEFDIAVLFTFTVNGTALLLGLYFCRLSFMAQWSLMILFEKIFIFYVNLMERILLV